MTALTSVSTPYLQDPTFFHRHQKCQTHACALSAMTMQPKALYSDKEDRLYTATACEFKVWEPHAMRCLATQEVAARSLCLVPFHNIVTASEQGVSLWRCKDSEVKQVGATWLYKASSVEYCGYDILAIGLCNGTVIVRNMSCGESGILSHLGKKPSSSVHTQIALLSSDQLATAAKNKIVKLWDLRSYQCLCEIKHPSGRISSLAALGKDNLIVGSYDGCIAVADVRQQQQVAVLQGPTSQVTALSAIDGKSGYLAAAYAGGSVKIWDIHAGSCVTRAYSAPASTIAYTDHSFFFGLTNGQVVVEKILF